MHEVTIYVDFESFPKNEEWLSDVAEYFETTYECEVIGVGSSPLPRKD